MIGLIAIQARLSSTRLPGKVLFHLGHGYTALSLMIARLKANREINENFKICVLTSTNECDSAIVDWCITNKVDCISGSENNVLERYYSAATQFGLPYVIRLTSDCPFSDSHELLRVFQIARERQVDFATNSFDGSSLVDGFDVEVMTREAVIKTFTEASSNDELEHVTFYPRNNQDQFKCLFLDPQLSGSYRRLTLDTPNDLKAIQSLIGLLDRDEILTTHMRQIIDIADEHCLFKYNDSLLKNHGW